jgi:RimJ/RimL family protein N-acetyltransferase
VIERRARGAGVEIEVHRRLNFAFRAERFRAQQATRTRAPLAPAPADAAKFAAADGSVVPRRFWRDAARFAAAGGGFAALDGGALAALAFTSFRRGRELELGIETLPSHRGRGYALEACAALIEECLARGLTPVWACREGNTASVRLAERLGFEITSRLPYYRLPPTARA